MSLGDIDFGESTNLNSFNSILFFFNMVLTLVCTMVVFLNFIIAEVSSSFAKITEKVSGLNEKERSLLIEEAEDMLL
jgi:ABC-type bacteriocin/lantibiotic exporter with double-glycine peptidase domain